MQKFIPKEIDLSTINGGNRYENNDYVSAESINAPLEASAYAQEVSNEAKIKADYALQKVNEGIAGTITLSAYPIGSIYISTSSISPAELFGGTWEQIKDKFLIGAGNKYSVGDTGGAETHTLTVAEMPSHRHSCQFDDGTLVGKYPGDAMPDESCYPPSGGFINGGRAHTLITFTSGDSQPHSIMPPYIAVNIWKRIS